MLGDYGPGELMESWVQSNIPMKRAGEGRDVAGLVAFLASEDATYITGQTIKLDGGRYSPLRSCPEEKLPSYRAKSPPALTRHRAFIGTTSTEDAAHFAMADEAHAPRRFTRRWRPRIPPHHTLETMLEEGIKACRVLRQDNAPW